jgi:hypothetical protein
LTDAKVQHKTTLAWKYPNLPFEFALVTVDGKRPGAEQSKHKMASLKRRKVRAMGVPGIAKVSGDTDWEKAIQRSPDLLRFAKFAMVNPLDLTLELHPNGLEVTPDSYLRFTLSRLSWDSITDTISGFDKEGFGVLRCQLQNMPQWIRSINVTWNTIELKVIKTGQEKRMSRSRIVKDLIYDLQSKTSTAPKPVQATVAYAESLRSIGTPKEIDVEYFKSEKAKFKEEEKKATGKVEEETSEGEEWDPSDVESTSSQRQWLRAEIRRWNLDHHSDADVDQVLEDYFNPHRPFAVNKEEIIANLEAAAEANIDERRAYRGERLGKH